MENIKEPDGAKSGKKLRISRVCTDFGGAVKLYKVHTIFVTHLHHSLINSFLGNHLREIKAYTYMIIQESS